MAWKVFYVSVVLFALAICHFTITSPNPRPDRYIEDEEYRAVWERTHYTVQDAMDLAYLTGQRPADVLKLNRSDIKDGAYGSPRTRQGRSYE